MDDSEYIALTARIRALMAEFDLPLLREQVLRTTFSDRMTDASPGSELLDLIDALGQQIALEDQATLDSAIDRLNEVSQSENPIRRIVVTTPSDDPDGRETEIDLRTTLSDMSGVREELASLRLLALGDGFPEW